MSHLSKAAILAAQDLQCEDVHVPEWGGTVRVSVMTGHARDAWEQSLVSGKGKVNVENVRARLAAACIVDENGARLFSDGEAAMLGAKSASALDRVTKVAQRLNRLTSEELEEAKGN